VSTYLIDRKRKRFNNAIDVVERLRNPTDPSTERTTPPRSAHLQLDGVPRTLDPVVAKEEFRQHDGVVTMMMFYRRRASPKHYAGMIEVCNCGGGFHTRLGEKLVCSRVPPTPVYKGVEKGRGGPLLWRALGESYSQRE